MQTGQRQEAGPSLFPSVPCSVPGSQATSYLYSCMSFYIAAFVFHNFMKSYFDSQMENVRRRHNYLPFIMELLKLLAKKGDLVDLAERVRSVIMFPSDLNSS